MVCFRFIGITGYPGGCKQRANSRYVSGNPAEFRGNFVRFCIKLKGGVCAGGCKQAVNRGLSDEFVWR